MSKVYSVRLCWTDPDRSRLVYELDESARFMAYDVGHDVSDEHVKLVDESTFPVVEKVEVKAAPKKQAPARRKTTGLHIDLGGEE